jgi:hypothetical protein
MNSCNPCSICTECVRWSMLYGIAACAAVAKFASMHVPGQHRADVTVIGFRHGQSHKCLDQAALLVVRRSIITTCAPRPWHRLREN